MGSGHTGSRLSVDFFKALIQPQTLHKSCFQTSQRIDQAIERISAMKEKQQFSYSNEFIPIISHSHKMFRSFSSYRPSFFGKIKKKTEKKRKKKHPQKCLTQCLLTF